MAERFNPILDAFADCGVQFALEVHPTEIAFDLLTARRALAALDGREEFGFNFDPSHLIWQGIDPVEFIRAFPERIYHVHMKDAIVRLNGQNGILGSHLPFGDPRRGWEFRSPGRGSVDFEEIIRALNQIKYAGPLSVEWEDAGMDREAGARRPVSSCGISISCPAMPPLTRHFPRPKTAEIFARMCCDRFNRHGFRRRSMLELNICRAPRPGHCCLSFC